MRGRRSKSSTRYEDYSSCQEIQSAAAQSIS